MFDKKERSMAWNPSPKVAVARDFSKQFNCDKVYIIAVNENRGQFEVVSYGSTKKKCDEADKHAKDIHAIIESGLLEISD